MLIPSIGSLQKISRRLPAAFALTGGDGVRRGRRLLVLAAALPASAHAAPAGETVPAVWGWLAAAGLISAGLGWLAARRANRAEMARATSPGSENRLAALLNQADCLLWEADVALVGDEMKWDFRLQPSGLAQRIFAGRKTPWELALWDHAVAPDIAEMNRRAQEALRTGQPGYEQRFRLIHSGRALWMHERVSITRKEDGRFWLVGLITDITAQQEAELARRASEEQLQQLLGHANCMLWQANVSTNGAGGFQWEWFVPRSDLYRRIAGEDPTVQPIMPWGNLEVPEYAEIEARSRHAMLNGLPGYEQEFRVVKAGATLWMHEQTSITHLAGNRWKLEGVVIDITAQRSAEEARRTSDRRLEQLFELADCLLWQGQVVRRADGELDWSVFTPRSRLYRRLHGRDPAGKHDLAWDKLRVPEFDQMIKTSADAMTGGAAGYEQVFHVPLAEGDIWLYEQVSIAPAGPGEWNLVGIITDITARHVAEEARRTSESRLRELLFRADCLLWEAEVVRTGEEWAWSFNIQPSGLCQQLYGLPQPRLEDGLWRRFDIPEAAEMRQRSQAAMTSGQPDYEQVFHIVKEDGSVVWIKESVTVKALGPARYSLVGVATDVTSQRAAEKAVRDAAARYRSLFQHTPVAIVETDFTDAGLWLDDLRRSGVDDLSAWLEDEAGRLDHAAGLVRVSGANQTAGKMFGHDGRIDHGSERGVMASPDALRMVRAALSALWEGRNTMEMAMDLRDFEGATRHMNVRWWVAQTANGLDLGQSVLVFVDLTELKQAEAALAAEKERLAVTLRAMAEGVITTDVAGRVQFMNPAAAALTQWDTTAIGLPVSQVCLLENDRTGTVVEVPVAQVARGDAVADLPPHTRLITREGQHRLVAGCCAPIHSADSRVIGMVIVFRDVTEHERLEQELIRATRLESVGVLAGGIAHDFNNILTGVMGNLALALLDIDAKSEAGERLREAETATLRARDLTQQLLTFAKGGEPVRAAVQLEAIVRETTAFALHGSSVRALFHLPPDLWPADADKGQIGRVVQNLVINAVQAMPSGGTLRVTACNEKIVSAGHPGLAPGDYVRISIADTGDGISPAHLARIFDPYFTTKQTGSGLGLAAVYSIIRKHRGSIDVESQVGQGSTFRFWLPALREARVDGSAPPVMPPSFSGRVLFMDDEATIRRMAGLMLQRLGFEVECVADGQEALEKFRAARAEGRPHALVIMDLTVPGGMGGREAVAHLRSIDPRVKAMVSSGYSSDPVLANYRTHGFCGVIAKPYKIEDLIRALRAALAEPGG